MRNNINLEYYTEDEEYEYLGLQPKPQWFRNLEKAWAVNHKVGEEKRAAIAKEEDDELYRHIGKPPDGTDAYIKWCDMMAGYLKKRKVGRPRLSPGQRKKPKIKRSDEMRLLLKDNGITVQEDRTLREYPGVIFLPNGRLKAGGFSSSVHQFLKNIDNK